MGSADLLLLLGVLFSLTTFSFLPLPVVDVPVACSTVMLYCSLVFLAEFLAALLPDPTSTFSPSACSCLTATEEAKLAFFLDELHLESRSSISLSWGRLREWVLV